MCMHVMLNFCDSTLPEIMEGIGSVATRLVKVELKFAEEPESFRAL